MARRRDVGRVARGRSRQVGASRAAETAISLARAFAPSVTSWLSLTRLPPEELGRLAHTMSFVDFGGVRAMRFARGGAHTMCFVDIPAAAHTMYFAVLGAHTMYFGDFVLFSAIAPLRQRGLTLTQTHPPTLTHTT